MDLGMDEGDFLRAMMYTKVLVDADGEMIFFYHGEESAESDEFEQDQDAIDRNDGNDNSRNVGVERLNVDAGLPAGQLEKTRNIEVNRRRAELDGQAAADGGLKAQLRNPMQNPRNLDFEDENDVQEDVMDDDFLAKNIDRELADARAREERILRQCVGPNTNPFVDVNK